MKYIVILLSIAAIALLLVGTGLGQDEEPFPPDPLPEYIWSIAWSPLGDVLAVGMGPERCFYEGNDYTIRLMDAQTGLLTKTIGVDNVCSATDLDWSPDGTQLLSSGIGEPIIVWDITTGYSVAGLAPNSFRGYIQSQWSPEGMQIASVQDAYEQITLWNATTGAVTLELDADFPTGVTWKPDNTMLAASGEAARITTVYDASTGQALRSFDNFFTAIAWSPDGTLLAGADTSNNIVLLNPDNGNVLKTLSGHTDTVGRLVWRSDSQYLASAAYDGTVRVWNIEAGIQTAEYVSYSAAPAVDWAPDGTQLAYGDAANTLRIVTNPHQPQATTTPITTQFPEMDT